MARGDHIRVRRLLYSHHGIDCGDGRVIHYTDTLWKRRDAAVVAIGGLLMVVARKSPGGSNG